MTSDQGPNGSATPRTKICVYCGASAGGGPAHMEMARQLARAMAAGNIDLGESPFSSTAPSVHRPPLPADGHAQSTAAAPSVSWAR